MEQRYYFREDIVSIFDCDTEFMEQLEDEDLISSVESDIPAQRDFPPDQVERIRIITNLVRDLGVNLPGAAVIMEMRENMILMTEQFDRILEALTEQMRGRRS